MGFRMHSALTPNFPLLIIFKEEESYRICKNRHVIKPIVEAVVIIPFARRIQGRVNFWVCFHTRTNYPLSVL